MNAKSSIPRYELDSVTSGKAVVVKKSWVPHITFSRTFTKVNAYNCAHLAMLAYESPEVVSQFFAALRSRDSRGNDTCGLPASPFLRTVDYRDAFSSDPQWFINDQQTDTQCFMALRKCEALICARGTEPTGPGMKDVLTDLHAEEVSFEEGKGRVHAGFYRAFKAARAKVDDFLAQNKVIEEKCNIIVCGHSLGGAIATLIGAYLRSITDKVMVYTFGSPRVGDRTFSNAYSRGSRALNYFRVVNANDIVTMVPMPGIDLKPKMLAYSAVGAAWALPLCLVDLDGDPFTHVGRMVHIRKEMNNPKSGIVWADYGRMVYATIKQPLAAAARVTLSSLLSAKSAITDHLMTSYEPIIRNDLSRAAQSYVNIENVDIPSLERELAEVKEGIAGLETEHNRLLTQSNTHKDLAAQPGMDAQTKSFHEKQSADLMVKVREYEVALANKRIEETSLDLTIEQYRERAVDKASLLMGLVGGQATADLEKEIEYHAR